MPTYVLVGIPAAIICVLGGLVAYERHTEKADERKREEGLKRWMDSARSSAAFRQAPGLLRFAVGQVHGLLRER